MSAVSQFWMTLRATPPFYRIAEEEVLNTREPFRWSCLLFGWWQGWVGTFTASAVRARTHWEGMDWDTTVSKTADLSEFCWEGGFCGMAALAENPPYCVGFFVTLFPRQTWKALGRPEGEGLTELIRHRNRCRGWLGNSRFLEDIHRNGIVDKPTNDEFLDGNRPRPTHAITEHVRYGLLSSSSCSHPTLQGPQKRLSLEYPQGAEAN